VTAGVADPLALALALRDGLRPVLGERLRGLVLYGSHARGEADRESDVDLLVLLDRVETLGSEIERIGPVASRLSLEHDVLVSALPVSETEFRSSVAPLLSTARQEGILVP